MWRRLMPATVGLLLAFGPPISSARIIYVDNDSKGGFRTIQDAIDAAVDGDVVIVGPGIYTGDGNRDIDFKGKAITVKSEQGARTCIVDCHSPPDASGVPGESHRGFHFHSAEDDRSILQGLTIRNGQASDPTELGGGILCESSSPQIAECIIVGNGARYGAGIGLQDSAAYVRDCTVSGNVAADGGGIWCSGSYTFMGAPIFERCIVSGNHAVYGSRFGGEGGGVQSSADARLVNSSISGNWAGYRGGGICFRMGPRRVLLLNSIVWGNRCGRGDGSQIALATYDTDTGYLRASYSVIGGGDWRLIAGGSLEPNSSWLEADPLFYRPGYWDPNGTPANLRDDFWVDGDYHLKSQAGRWDPVSKSWVKDDVTSSCIDAGDPNSPVGDEPQPNGGRINMGAYGGTAEASMSLESEIGPTPGLWTEPAPLVEINTATAEEWSPILSADGLTLYFGRVHAPDYYNGRIFAATRLEHAGRFTSPMPVWGDINNTGTHVLAQWVSPDELRMYYTIQEGARFHLMMSERYAKWSPWPVGWDIWKLNFLDDRLHAPRLSPDELTIFFSGPDAGERPATYDLWTATRTCHDCLFSEPVNLTKINTIYNDVHGFLSADGLCLYFASDRNGLLQLFKSTREDLRSPFGDPVHMPLFDTPGGESMFPCLSMDGKEFYFMRQDRGDRTTRDIYVSYRMD
jgi:hypothetical protein